MVYRRPHAYILHFHTGVYNVWLVGGVVIIVFRLGSVILAWLGLDYSGQAWLVNEHLYLDKSIGS